MIASDACYTAHKRVPVAAVPVCEENPRISEAVFCFRILKFISFTPLIMNLKVIFGKVLKDVPFLRADKGVRPCISLNAREKFAWVS